MPDQDADLMLLTAQGNMAAFEDLFNRHYERSVNIAYRLLGDRDSAEDIAMDAFARIYAARSSYTPSAKFTTYLYRIVVNLCINLAKRKRHIIAQPTEELELSATTSDDPAICAQRAEVSRRVRAAVLALPANQRTALVLTRYECLSYEDVARVMNVSIKAVESLLHRAKANLRKSLAGLVED